MLVANRCNDPVPDTTVISSRLVRRLTTHVQSSLIILRQFGPINTDLGHIFWEFVSESNLQQRLLSSVMQLNDGMMGPLSWVANLNTNHNGCRAKNRTVASVVWPDQMSIPAQTMVQPSAKYSS